MHKYLATILLLTTMLWQPSGTSAAQRTILVIPKDQQTLYWNILQEGAIQAGKERQAEIIFRGPRSADDHDAQAEIIKDGMHQKVSAIVFAPNHTTRTARLLDEATQQGIKIILIDSDMEFEGRTSFVASDNRLAGMKAGKALLSLIGGKGTAFMIRHKKNNASTLARETGFLESMSRAKDVTVVDLGYLGTGMGNTYRRVLDALKEYPHVEGVFASSEINTLGLIKALQEFPNRDHPKIVGFDYTPEILQALRDGTVDALIAQDPYRMGYLSIMTACDALDGKTVEKRVKIETILVTDPNDSRLKLTPPTQ